MLVCRPVLVKHALGTQHGSINASVNSHWIRLCTWRVSNWNTCSTPATRILKKTAEELEPNCMMSRSSAECRYSFGTGRKKCTPL
jgi:hypothetical protein